VYNPTRCLARRRKLQHALQYEHSFAPPGACADAPAQQSAMIFLSLHTIRAARLQKLVFSASFAASHPCFIRARTPAGIPASVATAFCLLRDLCVRCGSFCILAAAKCSSAAPNCSSDRPNCSRCAQLEPFPGEPIFTTISRQTTYKSDAEKSASHLSLSPPTLDFGHQT